MDPHSRDILIVASWFPSFQDPVAGRFVADQAEALHRAGTRVRVLSFDPADLFGAGPVRGRLAAGVEQMSGGSPAARPYTFAPRGSASAEGIPVARLAIPGGRTPQEPILHALRYRERALRRLAAAWLGATGSGAGAFRPALIHAHTGYPDGAAAATLSELLAVPLVITEHATFLDRQLAIPEVRMAYLAGARRASRVLGVSRVLATQLAASLPEIADRVGIMSNTVDIESFPLGQPSERRPAELLFVGYLKEIKGIDVLLRALALVRQRRSDVTLRLVGDAADSSLDRRWRMLAQELGVLDAVAFDAPMDRAGVATAMRHADVFVHASRWETFGVVAAEALATGLPVVATDSGGVAEILGDHADSLGVLVPRDNPEAFAAAILDVLDRRATFDPIRLRASVADRFGSAAVAGRLVALYDEIIGGWSPGGQRVRAADGSPGSAGQTGAPRPARPIVAVAFDPDRAARLATLPVEVRRDIVLVTSVAAGQPDATGFRDVILADLGDRVRALADTRALGPRSTGWRRIARALRHPVAVARRRGLLPGLEAAIRGRGGAAVRTGVQRAVTGLGAPPIIVCADGVDYLAAGETIEAGAAFAAPGGLRWLVDQLSSE